MSENCLDELSAGMFLDDEGRSPRRIGITAHLKSCSRCRKLLDEMKKEDARLEEMLAIPSALDFPDLVPGVMQEVESAEPPRRRSQPRKAGLLLRCDQRWLWATAAGLLLSVFLAILLLLPRNPPAREARGGQVILCYAMVEGQEVQSHIYDDRNPDIQFIWLEKVP